VNPAEPADITIIGGGPTGLFASFYAGMRGVSVRIVDSLPELGGQLTALYPEKYIYDVGGFPRILAKDLARSMEEQGLQFGADVRLEEEVRTLDRREDGFVLTTSGGVYPTKAVIIAGGKGAFAPRHLDCPGYHELLGKGVTYHVKDPGVYRDRRVLIVGGGDSALDWTLGLLDIASCITLIHRREGFRAHRSSVLTQAKFDEQIQRIAKEELSPLNLKLLVRELPGGRNRFIIKEQKTGAVCDLLNFDDHGALEPDSAMVMEAEASRG
jgi:thioredoxin reductase (NADPH)